MRWFKHLTNDTGEKQFLAELEDQFGWEGFGRWYKLKEKVGEIMGGESGCSATYPWSEWQTFLKGKRNKLETFLKYLEDKGKIKLKQNGNFLEIEVPILKQLRDEYSRKSGQSQVKTPDKTPDVIPAQSTETQSTETQKGSEAAHSPGDGSDPGESGAPNSAGDPPGSGSSQAEWIAESKIFIERAMAAHLAVRGSVLNIPNMKKDMVRVVRWIQVLGLSAEVLLVCWDHFLKDMDPWLMGDEKTPPKPRSLAIFDSRLDDYLVITKAVEQADWKRELEAENSENVRKELHRMGQGEFKRLIENFDLTDAEYLFLANDNYIQKYKKIYLTDEQAKRLVDLVDKARKQQEKDQLQRDKEEKAAQKKQVVQDEKRLKQKRIEKVAINLENKKNLKKMKDELYGKQA